MRRVCLGCGNEVPNGSDFCYVCGRWATDALPINDQGELLTTEFCLNCQEPLPNDSVYCPNCGFKREPSQARAVVVPQRRKLTAIDYIALALAIFPAFYNIFGLGQIVLRRWSKAFVYMVLTVVFIYLESSITFGTTSGVIFFFGQLMLFFFSLQDVMNAIIRRGM